MGRQRGRGNFKAKVWWHNTRRDIKLAFKGQLIKRIGDAQLQGAINHRRLQGVDINAQIKIGGQRDLAGDTRFSPDDTIKVRNPKGRLTGGNFKAGIQALRVRPCQLGEPHLPAPAQIKAGNCGKN